MDRKFFVPLGILLFFIGITLILNSISTITGLVVVEDVNIISGSLMGVGFIVFGIFSFIFGSKNSDGSRFHTIIEERGRG
jgi:hypothetical protein